MVAGESQLFLWKRPRVRGVSSLLFSIVNIGNPRLGGKDSFACGKLFVILIVDIYDCLFKEIIPRQ
jgi:hypothetical protein